MRFMGQYAGKGHFSLKKKKNKGKGKNDMVTLWTTTLGIF